MAIQRVRGIGIASAAKMGCILYAAIGLIIGCFIALASMLGGFAALANEQRGGFFGLFLGVGAIIICPIFYGIVGAIAITIVAAVYNVAARAVGGLELELD